MSMVKNTIMLLKLRSGSNQEQTSSDGTNLPQAVPLRSQIGGPVVMANSLTVINIRLKITLIKFFRFLFQIIPE
jgi:hypothetical protein